MFVFVLTTLSVLIRVHPRPKKFGVGATRRVARTESGVKGDKALFLTLGTLGTFGCGSAALYYCCVKSLILVKIFS